MNSNAINDPDENQVFGTDIPKSKDVIEFKDWEILKKSNIKEYRLKRILIWEKNLENSKKNVIAGIMCVYITDQATSDKNQFTPGSHLGSCISNKDVWDINPKKIEFSKGESITKIFFYYDKYIEGINIVKNTGSNNLYQFGTIDPKLQVKEISITSNKYLFAFGGKIGKYLHTISIFLRENNK